MPQGYPDRETAEQELKLAGELNPGKWIDHSIYVAKAAETIAKAAGMIEKWRKMFETKHYFDRLVGDNIYSLLPGIKENL